MTQPSKVWQKQELNSLHVVGTGDKVIVKKTVSILNSSTSEVLVVTDSEGFVTEIQPGTSLVVSEGMTARSKSGKDIPVVVKESVMDQLD